MLNAQPIPRADFLYFLPIFTPQLGFEILTAGFTMAGNHCVWDDQDSRSSVGQLQSLFCYRWIQPDLRTSWSSERTFPILISPGQRRQTRNLRPSGHEYAAILSLTCWLERLPNYKMAKNPRLGSLTHKMRLYWSKKLWMLAYPGSYSIFGIYDEVGKLGIIFQLLILKTERCRSNAHTIPDNKIPNLPLIQAPEAMEFREEHLVRMEIGTTGVQLEASFILDWNPLPPKLCPWQGCVFHNPSIPANPFSRSTQQWSTDSCPSPWNPSTPSGLAKQQSFFLALLLSYQSPERQSVVSTRRVPTMGLPSPFLRLLAPLPMRGARAWAGRLPGVGMQRLFQFAHNSVAVETCSFYILHQDC